MTDKFENLVSEMDKLCMNTKIVPSRKRARELSLKKWSTIRKMSARFFAEFNVRCGFCGYGEFKAKETGSGGRCEYCGVKTICDNMLKKSRELSEETDELINGLMDHFENMKVAGLTTK